MHHQNRQDSRKGLLRPPQYLVDEIHGYCILLVLLIHGICVDCI